jgi:hypothetical protein
VKKRRDAGSSTDAEVALMQTMLQQAQAEFARAAEPGAAPGE